MKRLSQVQRASLIGLALLTGGATVSSGQTTPTSANPIPSSAPREPGSIPPGTPPEVEARWRTLMKGLSARNSSGAALDAFDVRFELLDRAEPDGRPRPGSIETKARVRWLAPYNVAFATEDGREIGFGERSGYWLTDGKEAVALKGREFIEDKRRIQSILTLAQNFAHLSDLSKVTLVSMNVVSEPPTGALPNANVKWKRLDWIEIVSPDFKLVEGIEAFDASRRGIDLYRVRFGYETPATDDAGIPTLTRLRALHIVKEPLGSDPETLAQVACTPEQLIVVEDLRESGGFVVPHKLWIYTRVPKIPELAQFPEKPDRELYLLNDSRLGPEFSVETFDPFKDDGK